MLRHEPESWVQITAEEQGQPLVQHLHLYAVSVLILYSQDHQIQELSPESPRGQQAEGEGESGELQKGKGPGP